MPNNILSGIYLYYNFLFTFMTDIQKIQVVRNLFTASENVTSLTVPLSKLREHALWIKKASFFRRVYLTISNPFQESTLKIKICKETKDKSSDYYIRISEICRFCGLSSTIVKKLKAEDKLEKLIHLTLETYKRLDANDLQEFQRIQNNQIELAIALLGQENISPVDFVHTVIDQEILSRLKKKFDMGEEQYEKIKHLMQYVPLANLNELLTNPENNFSEQRKLLNTFYQASDELKNGLPIKQKYFKGNNKLEERSYFSYILAPNGNFYIILPGELTHGGFSKIKKTYNVTNLNDKNIARVLRGNKHVLEFHHGLSVMQAFNLYSCPYIVPCSEYEIQITGKLKNKQGKGIIGSEELKFVSIEKMMEKDGASIESNDIPLIAQFCHDIAKALDYMHRRNVVHGDVKPHNGLIKDGRGFLTDFTTSGAVSWSILAGSPLYASPELDKFPINSPRSASKNYDNFSLGFTIMDLLFECRNKKNTEIYKVLRNKNKSEIEDYFDKLKKSVDTENLKDEYKVVKKQLIEIAQKLFNPPMKRMTSAQATLELSQIVGVVTTDPRVIPRWL